MPIYVRQLLSVDFVTGSISSYILLISLSIFYSAGVSAHAKLLVASDVPPRYDNAGIKGADPCGNESGSVTNMVSHYPRGATVKVEWVETIDHYGYFEVDFSLDGGATFGDAVTVNDPSGSTQHQFAIDYTLPNALCGSAGCLLRMRQFMASSSTFYYSCANVVLSDPDATPQDPVNSLGISADATTIDLNWINPALAKGILVVRDTQGQSAALNNMTVYHVGDAVGASGQVLFKSETSATQFIDTQFYGDKDYTYSVYAYSDSYYYSSPVADTVHTEVGTGLDNGTGGGSPSAKNDSSSDSGGATDNATLFALTLLLLLAYRRKAQQRTR